MLCIDEEHVEGGSKHEVGCDGTFHEDTRLARRTDITQRVVMSFDAFGQVGVHEHVVKGVNIRVSHVAICLIHCPGPYVSRNNFLFLLGLSRVGACIHRHIRVRFQL